LKDTITVDVSCLRADALQPDSLIDLMNERSTVDTLAQEAGTIGYEILTSLGGRYFRKYVGG
jgi:alanine racemase